MIFARTDRLILRKAREEDVEPLLLSWSDPDMTRYTGLRPNIRQFLAGMIADMQRKNPGDTEPGGPWYQYVVERAADGVLVGDVGVGFGVPRSEEHTSELQSLMRISYAVFCLKKKTQIPPEHI